MKPLWAFTPPGYVTFWTITHFEQSVPILSPLWQQNSIGWKGIAMKKLYTANAHITASLPPAFICFLISSQVCFRPSFSMVATLVGLQQVRPYGTSDSISCEVAPFSTIIIVNDFVSRIQEDTVYKSLPVEWSIYNRKAKIYIKDFGYLCFDM